MERSLCYAKPVAIGSDCWFGANVVVCPGVTIGRGCVIGAGSVFTRDIPANTFAAGVPARVIREITKSDSISALFDALRSDGSPETKDRASAYQRKGSPGHTPLCVGIR